MTPYKLFKAYASEVWAWREEEPINLEKYSDESLTLSYLNKLDLFKREYDLWLSSADKFPYVEGEKIKIIYHAFKSEIFFPDETDKEVIAGLQKGIDVTSFCEIRDGLAYFKPVEEKETQESLRKRFFAECTNKRERDKFTNTYNAPSLRVNMTPHNVFEWFKNNMK